ncbi:ABC transporter permease [Paenibacillus sp. 79R4]|uniref:ABC transporter permease n=1 Tax=Paenibacillus sp. 79R4 TaxID=2212847 RepID=UPI0015B870A4|nr:ABC transporter permease [Paenibacillus sp. 79R4]NWL87928.1 ABC transporter permease [Paenibacillus sp. 79R4]
MNKAFLLRKTLRLLMSLLLFSFLLYGLLYLSTGDPALGLLRRLGVQAASQQVIEETRAGLGINGGFWQQYIRWLFNMMQGDFGRSFMTNAPVLSAIVDKLAVTLQLMGSSFILYVAFSLGLGSLIGNFSFAQGLKPILSIVLSFPIYWLALLAIFIFGVQLKWFPFIGSSTSKHFMLPVIVICLSEGSYLAKMVGDLVGTVAHSERQVVAKFRGIKWYYRFYYQLKEVFVPLITLYGNSLTHLFGGTILIEIIFSISGLGKLLMDAISARDYPVIQGITLIVACATFLLNYLMDLLIEKMDSRIQIHPQRGK